jgi:hypothetical protein
MTDSPGWTRYNFNTGNGKINSSPTSVTVSTTGDLTLGDVTSETFKVGTTTYTYLGTASTPSATGFYASDGTNTFFFSKTTGIANSTVVTTAADTPTTSFTLCFYPGTLIATPAGQVAVETLAAGDLVLTTEGEAKPIRWIGLQTVTTFFADPLTKLPVRIKTGALGDNLPTRDLLLSPGHALLLDGVLVQAGALVNGTSIVRETDLPASFTYRHIELADQLLILAEGIPAETFIDNASREAFDNWAEHEAIQAAAPMVELDLPRAMSHRQVPAATRQRLAARAAVLFAEGSVAAA